MLSRFPQIAIASHETLHLTLGFVGMHSVAVSIWAVTKFSYSSSGVYLSDILPLRPVDHFFTHLA